TQTERLLTNLTYPHQRATDCAIPPRGLHLNFEKTQPTIYININIKQQHLRYRPSPPVQPARQRAMRLQKPTQTHSPGPSSTPPWMPLQPFCASSFDSPPLSLTRLAYLCDCGETRAVMGEMLRVWFGRRDSRVVAERSLA